MCTSITIYISNNDILLAISNKWLEKYFFRNNNVSKNDFSKMILILSSE